MAADDKALQTLLTSLARQDKASREVVTRAYELSKKAHEEHTRFSGEPYITHLTSVATILAEMGMGARTVAAGLLHDIIEDTDVTATEIKEQFGEEILFLVEGVTKLGSVRYKGADRHNESLRKLFVATSQDIRVLMIKLADRLHNMQTLQYVPKEKQRRIAQETLEIYVPVAHRLGMGRIRKELEDLAFPYVFPDEYKKVQNVAGPFLKHANAQLEKLRKTIQKNLAETGITDFRTECRVKGMYSLFRKLERRDWDIDSIFDLLAVRIIVNDIEECYQVLGIIHKLWRPLPQRVKDYIAFPKPNGYRSIHTTVITHDRRIIEIQIRTDEMHREAEFGVASHLIYKHPEQEKSLRAGQRTWMNSLIPALFRPFSWRRGSEESTSVSRSHAENKENVPHWIREIGEAHQSIENTDEFVTGLKEDFFSHRIFVFTPQGDVIDLPVGATPVDFAYAIHTDIGNHANGAKVNGKLVQLDTELANGNRVEIITKRSSMPSRKWLDFVKTSLAQRNIRAALEEQKQRR